MSAEKMQAQHTGQILIKMRDSASEFDGDVNRRGAMSAEKTQARHCRENPAQNAQLPWLALKRVRMKVGLRSGIESANDRDVVWLSGFAAGMNSRPGFRSDPAPKLLAGPMTSDQHADPLWHRNRRECWDYGTVGRYLRIIVKKVLTENNSCDKNSSKPP